MAKLYTFDGKLLTEGAEIRIDDKVYKIDDRKKTVEKALELFEKAKTTSESMAAGEEIIKLAFGKNYKEIADKDWSFSGFLSFLSLIIGAMTGEDPVKVEERFQEQEQG